VGSDCARRILRRMARTCGLASAAIGVAALAGWATGQPILLGVRRRYIPMAPNTAIGLLLLGAGLFAMPGPVPRTSRSAGTTRPGSANPPEANGHPWSVRLAGLGAVLTMVISSLRLLEYFAGLELDVDSWIVPVPHGKFGLAPVGKMSLFTAIAFLWAGVSLALRAWGRGGRVADDLAGSAAVVTAATGLVFVLGYLFSPGAPLLYGGETIPMALNTALGFVALGSGLAAAAGPGAFPSRRLCGPSMHARLLRVFLPLVVGTVVVVAWLTHVISTSAGASSAAVSSAAMATAAIFLCAFVVEQVAGRVGIRLERAEAALRTAHDVLEVKVEERTRALSMANDSLAKAFHELSRAHDELQQTHRELQQTQGRMLEQAKLASLGQTAAGVAHEINNPLAFVTNNIVVLKREVSSLHDILSLYQQAEQTLAQYERELHARIQDLSEQVDLPYVLGNLGSLLDRSREGLKRIQKIVQDLRDFARLDEAEYKEADLNEGIGATVNILHGLAANRRVSLETDLGPIPRLNCFPAKINMVVQNLVFNAIDASSPGGSVVVRTREAVGAIEVEVSDNGSGIDPALRQRIFEPFFTTKPVGMGAGLGLSMCYGILKDHGGTIDFESTPGRGTRFFFRLPISAAVGQNLTAAGSSDGKAAVAGHG
jgi:two-component system, NtrC family, sensor kinase